MRVMISMVRLFYLDSAGSFKQPAAKDVERQRSSFFQSLRRSSKTPTPNPNPVATPTSPPSPPTQQPIQTASGQDPASSHKQPAGAFNEGITVADATRQSAAPIAGQSLHSVQSTPDRSASTSPEKASTPAASQQQADSSAEATGASQHHANGGDGPAKASQLSNGHKAGQVWDAKDPQLKVSAEEEAFLRSLGWTEPGDDEDGKQTTP